MGEAASEVSTPDAAAGPPVTWFRPKRRALEHIGNRYAAATYTPGDQDSLEACRGVAQLKHPAAEVAEIPGWQVLMARFPEDHPPAAVQIVYLAVPDGHDLVYSEDFALLYPEEAAPFRAEHRRIR